MSGEGSSSSDDQNPSVAPSQPPPQMPALGPWSTPAIQDSAFYAADFLLGAGIVIIQESTDKIVVVYDHRYDNWFLPRGRKDIGESLEAAALREGYEEVCLSLPAEADVYHCIAVRSLGIAQRRYHSLPTLDNHPLASHSLINSSTQSQYTSPRDTLSQEEKDFRTTMVRSTSRFGMWGLYPKMRCAIHILSSFHT